MKLLPKGTDPQVMQAAVAVRKEVETWAAKLDQNNLGCGEISPDNLCGACGIASFLLQRTLAQMNIASTFVMGRYYRDGYSSRNKTWDNEDYDRTNHCWLRVGKQIIDLTATQFDVKEKVSIVGADSDHYHAVLEGFAAIKRLMDDWDEESPRQYPLAMKSIIKHAVKEIHPS